ncbi:hypothetical protein NDU88_002745 [Pleurodeles waltl]|uniref:Uncharacterized protein n=1 Tax=Pleurodeles waltl TaxID=8319 RepID=A0AAV7VC24_PLEWA|nr:hypothetical protein NDU88_002745 [Pleurodeles waltl]
MTSDQAVTEAAEARDWACLCPRLIDVTAVPGGQWLMPVACDLQCGQMFPAAARRSAARYCPPGRPPRPEEGACSEREVVLGQGSLGERLSPGYLESPGPRRL